MNLICNGKRSHPDGRGQVHLLRAYRILLIQFPYRLCMENTNGTQNLRLLRPVLPTRPTGQKPNLLLITCLPG
jgi:hypothetical protein